MRVTHIGSQGDAHGHEEHVGDGVLQADGHEGGDGRPQAEHLAGQRGRCVGVVHGHAHEPVAEDGAQDDLRRLIGGTASSLNAAYNTHPDRF